MSKNKKRKRAASAKAPRTIKRCPYDPVLVALAVYGALVALLDIAFIVYAAVTVNAAEHGLAVPAPFTPFAIAVIAVNALLGLSSAIYPLLRRR